MLQIFINFIFFNKNIILVRVKNNILKLEKKLNLKENFLLFFKCKFKI
jgi:hypothetical protein